MLQVCWWWWWWCSGRGQSSATHFISLRPPQSNLMQNLRCRPAALRVFLLQWLQRFTASPVFPRQGLSLLILSLTLFHFSLPSSFISSINTRCSLPSERTSRSSLVPSHFFTIRRRFWAATPFCWRLEQNGLS